jgi:hypothetical protein
MQGFQADLAERPALQNLLWVDKNDIVSKYPIPSAFSFFKKKVLGNQNEELVFPYL